MKAKIVSTNSAGPQKVSVTVPASQAAASLRSLTDVDVGALGDGGLLQYSSGTDKFVLRNELSTETGTIKFNGGNY